MSIFSIIPYIRTFLTFVAVILCCVGVGVRHFKSLTTDYFIYELRQYGRKFDYSNVYCNALSTRMDAAWAFAVIACVAMGTTFVCMGIKIGARRLQFLPLVPLAFIGSITGFLASLISWSLVINVFHSEYCGMSKPLNSDDVDLAAGICLHIVAWILMTIDLVLAVIALFAPAPPAEEEKA